MSKNNYNTTIDFGSSKIRIGVFDMLNSNSNFIAEKECFSNLKLKDFNIASCKDVIYELIKESEKNFGIHINNVNLMIDPPDLFSIDLSIKKRFEKKKISSNDIKYLIQEAKLLIQKNYNKKKLIHIIIQKYNINEIDYYDFPSEQILCNNLILELKFICFDNLIYENLINNFKYNHISIKNVYCSSYVKSLNYINFFDNYKKIVFLDIGLKKSTLCVYDKNRLILIKNISVGGDHITSDISKIFKIEKEKSEEIKKLLNKSNSTFSNDAKENLNDNNIIKNLDKKISSDLLNKVIYARIDEILDLIFEGIDLLELIGNNKNSILIFTGEGSKILNKNSIYLKEDFDYFGEINFFEESNRQICESGLNFISAKNNYEVNIVPKKLKKTGFFEKLFHLFN